MSDFLSHLSIPDWVWFALQISGAFIVIALAKSALEALVKSWTASAFLAGVFLLWGAIAVSEERVSTMWLLYISIGWIGIFVFNFLVLWGRPLSLAPWFLDVENRPLLWLVVAPVGFIIGIVAVLVVAKVTGLTSPWIFGAPLLAHAAFFKELISTHSPYDAMLLLVFGLLAPLAWVSFVCGVAMIAFLAPFSLVYWCWEFWMSRRLEAAAADSAAHSSAKP
jgi:hypothetical protein